MATVTVCPGGSCNYTQIQTAINDPLNDIIQVFAGTYTTCAFGQTVPQTVIAMQAGVIIGGVTSASGTGGVLHRVVGFGDTICSAGVFSAGTGNLEISGCVVNGVGFASSCCWASGKLTIDDCTLSTSADYGVHADGSAARITIEGNVTLDVSVGSNVAALRMQNSGTIHVNGNITLDGDWTTAILAASSGTMTGNGTVECVAQSMLNGINCAGGILSFGHFDFVGSNPVSGTGIRCSSGSVQISLSGSLDRTQRGIHVSGSGSVVTVNRMSIGATTGHFHGVFAETIGRANLYGCTIENCIGQASNDGSAANVVTGADVVMDSAESEDGLTTIINRIENCSSATNQDGGAIAVNGSGSTFLAYALRVIGCTALGTGSGGAIRVEASGTLTLGRLVNETDGDSGENGAVSYAGWDAFDSGRVDQGGCLISGCSGLDGGAISLDTATATVVNTRFTENQARRT